MNFVAVRLHEFVRSSGLKLLIAMEQKIVIMVIIIGVNVIIMLRRFIKVRLAKINGWQALKVISSTPVYE